MAEFYSYAERQAGNQIDWSKIGSDVTKTLNEVVDLREKKKAAIDEETNKNLETLQNAPKGEDTDVNGWTINAANDLTTAKIRFPFISSTCLNQTAQDKL